jgi:hypothetical protein
MRGVFQYSFSNSVFASQFPERGQDCPVRPLTFGVSSGFSVSMEGPFSKAGTPQASHAKVNSESTEVQTITSAMASVRTR